MSDVSNGRWAWLLTVEPVVAFLAGIFFGYQFHTYKSAGKELANDEDDSEVGQNFVCNFR